MPKPITFLYISLFALLAISCKNEAKNTNTSEVENINTEITQTPVKRAAKKDLSPEDVAMLKSVMSRVMYENKLKKFTSYIVTAELTNQLANEEGPFTVFAPSNASFESLPAEKVKFYANPENRSELEEMLKSHIVVGKMDNETLLQNVRKNGKTKLKTLAGNTITASQSGEVLTITDAKGGKATILNNGTEASNGVVYMVDGVLNAN